MWSGRSSAPADVSGLAGGLTVHVVGRITAPVQGFLLPAIRALQAMGKAQALVFVDGAQGGLPQGLLPGDVLLVPVADSPGMLRRAGALHAGLGEFADGHAVAALHLHGLLPGFAGLRWLHGRAQQTRHLGGDAGPQAPMRVYFSPHASRALEGNTLVRTLLAWMLRAGFGRSAQRAIVNLQPEARLVAPFGRLPVTVIGNPVPQIFFETQPKEARRPLLLSCCLDPHGLSAAVDQFARLAVLLNGDELGISFNWVGRAEGSAAATLKAANVGCFDDTSDEGRARRLASAWIYVAPTAERGFPVRLVEALAVGLPCVALDTPAHRSVLDDGVTGWLCADLCGLLQRIAELVDSPELRRRMGDAARRAALDRFSEAVFQRELQRSVDVDPGERHLEPGAARETVQLGC